MALPRPRTLATALLLLPSLAAAQALGGRVVDDASGRGVAGVVVALVDGGGAVVAGAVTDREGSFALARPDAGSFTARAERVGHRIAPVRVEVGGDADPGPLLLRAVSAPLALDPVRVVAESRCTVRPDDGGATAALWERARQALFGTAVLQDGALIEFEVRTWVRDVSFSAGTARTRSSDRRTVRGRPFVTLPPADLVRNGFVRREADRVVHHGPDAHLLLSDPFLDGYCFRAEARRGRLIGLAFEPLGRDVVGIEGVLWMDAVSGELRHLEYRYTDAPGADPRRRAHGRIEFRHLREGGWIVERWWIRRTAASAGPAGEPRPGMVLEAGGEVRRVRRVDAPPHGGVP